MVESEVAIFGGMKRFFKNFSIFKTSIKAAAYKRQKRY
jgi:hypothetical protein